jgi:hypothetical protein
MLDGLGISPATLTPAALLAILILLIAVGRLVPRRTLEDIIHDRNEWRAAHRISEQSRMELAGMVGELLEHARTTDAFIRALPNPHGTPPPTAQFTSVESAATQAVIESLGRQQEEQHRLPGGGPGA